MIDPDQQRLDDVAKALDAFRGRAVAVLAELQEGGITATRYAELMAAVADQLAISCKDAACDD